MALCCTVAATHYDIVEEENIELDIMMNSPDDTILPKGVKLFYKMIKAANNNLPIQPVIPALVTSTDDTTFYIFMREKENQRKNSG